MIITAHVKPNSTKGPLVLEENGQIVAYLREKPKDSEANTALVKMLAKYHGLAKSQVRIISGHKSRIKRIELVK